jgi:hypothetical protein
MSAPFNRRGQIKITVVAVVVISLIAVAQISVHNMAGRHLALVPVLYAIAIVPLLAAFYMLAGIKRRPIPALNPAT